MYGYYLLDMNFYTALSECRSVTYYLPQVQAGSQVSRLRLRITGTRVSGPLTSRDKHKGSAQR